MKIFITGASGFVGKSLINQLSHKNLELVLLKRRLEAEEKHQVVLGDLISKFNWSSSLENCDVVIHLAARVHVFEKSNKLTSDQFTLVNVDATENFARQALAAGVKRFIFVSTAKVFGESSPVNQPFSENDDCNPQDAYAISKLKAEEALLEIAKKTGMEVVIIRPPLVYGQGVKANFASLLKLVKFGVPLPFGAVSNKRSLIYVENLAHFIMHCLAHPAAKNEVFSISDDYDVSTASLIQAIAQAFNLPNRNFKFPENWLYWSAKFFGKQKQMMRLCGCLQVDISKAKNLLEWQPPFSLAEGLKHTVEDWVH